MPEPASEHPPSARPDTVIAGRYKTVRVVGRGGMGTVYEAVHTWTGRRVALKTLLPHIADDAHAVERFRREARAGVQGAHRNIVEVLDMGVDDETGALYLAQEFLVGEDLSTRLAREQTLSLRDAFELLIPVMAALDAAHRAGVVHRDVKPANLFLSRSPSGEVIAKVIDFGIAALADTDAVTRTGVPVGTPQYMAPEQARGARDLDARTDVWSMGAVWFEALTGRRAIEGASYHEIMATLLAGTAPDLRAHTAVLPAGVRGAVEGALRVDRSRRHASMGAFARALLADPSLASEPWIKAISDEHPFAEMPAPAPAFEARASSPITLDLPTPDGSAAHAETLSSSEAAAPRATPAAPVSAPISAPITVSSVMRARWPAVAVAALAFALTGAWLARPTDAPTTPIATPPSTAPAVSAATLEAPVFDAATPSTQPARANAPVVEVDAEAPPADTPSVAAPRHAQRARAALAPSRDASVERATHAEINGAPVLEP